MAYSEALFPGYSLATKKMGAWFCEVQNWHWQVQQSALKATEMALNILSVSISLSTAP